MILPNQKMPPCTRAINSDLTLPSTTFPRHSTSHWVPRPPLRPAGQLLHLSLLSIATAQGQARSPKPARPQSFLYPAPAPGSVCHRNQTSCGSLTLPRCLQPQASAPGRACPGSPPRHPPAAGAPQAGLCDGSVTSPPRSAPGSRATPPSPRPARGPTRTRLSVPPSPAAVAGSPGLQAPPRLAGTGSA